MFRLIDAINITATSFDLRIDQEGFVAGYEDRVYLGSQYFTDPTDPAATLAATLTAVDADGVIPITGLTAGRVYWVKLMRFNSGGTLIATAANFWGDVGAVAQLVVQTLATSVTAQTGSLGETWTGTNLADRWEPLPLDGPLYAAQYAVQPDDGAMGGAFLRIGGSPSNTLAHWGVACSKQLYDHRQAFTVEFKVRMSASFISGFCGLGVLYNGEPAYMGVANEGGTIQYLYDGAVYGQIDPAMTKGQVYTLRFEYNPTNQVLSLYRDGVFKLSHSSTNPLQGPFSIYLSGTPSTGCLDFGPLTITGTPAYGCVDWVGWESWQRTNACVVAGSDSSGALRGLAPQLGATVLKGSDNNWYRSILSKVSATTDKPITGANWATYWELTTAPVNTLVPTWGAIENYTADGPHHQEWYSKGGYTVGTYERGQVVDRIVTAPSPVYHRIVGESFGSLLLKARNRGAGGNTNLKIYVRDASDDSLIPDSEIPGNSAGLASTSTALVSVSLSSVTAASIYLDVWMQSAATMTPSQVPMLEVAAVVPAAAGSPVNASLGTLSLTASSTLALGTLSGVEYASLGTLALTAPATLGLGALSGVTTAANQIRAPNGDVRMLRNVDGTIRTFNLLA